MRHGVKEASLAYDVLAEKEVDRELLSLVRIVLHTGRTHQIRVQFSSRRHPLVGDRKYGGSLSHAMGLLSYRLTFTAMNGELLTVVAKAADKAPFSIFDTDCP